MTATSIDLSGSPRRHRREAFFRWLFTAAAISTVIISVAIVWSLLDKSIVFLTNIDLGSLWSSGWFPRRGEFDIKTLFVGTVLTTAIAMVFATPLGLATAIYLAEYAPRRVRKVLKPIVEILASIPSVVLGFFALTWISPNLVQKINPASQSFNLMAAGIAIGILITPLIAAVSEDALRSVPASLREASYGLGARKVTTTLRVVVPAAISGIVASLILAISRGVGETMVVAIAAGGSGGALFSTDIFAEGQTITAAMASLAVSGSDQVAVASGRGASQAPNSLFFLGLLLFVMTMALNVIGGAFVRRVQNRY